MSQLNGLVTDPVTPGGTQAGLVAINHPTLAPVTVAEFPSGYSCFHPYQN